MRWFRRTLDEAGFSKFTSTTALLAILLTGSMVGAVAYEVFKIIGVALSAAVGTIGMLLEVLNARALSRRALIVSIWPEVLDALISALSSGSSLTESIVELADDGPPMLRVYFQKFRQELDGGKQLADSLQNLKHRLGNIYSDRLVELLLLVSSAGGAGLVESLRNQVKLARADLAFSGELTSRLGWITGTAKIAVGAPWIVVALLATRPENASAYSSPEGSMLLIFGLLLSIFAFRLVKTFGLLPVSPRVFA